MAAITTSYQEQFFPRKEAGDLTASSHKATYELPPGVFDGSGAYIGLEARLDSKHWPTEGTAHAYEASPANAKYLTALVCSRPDLALNNDNLNDYQPEQLIPFDPSQFIREASLRTTRTGPIHHVTGVSLWRSALDRMRKSKTRKRAEAVLQHGPSVGADRNANIYTGFQETFIDRAPKDRMLELRADITEVLPVIGQALDTREAGMTYIETFMDLTAAKGVSAFFPRPPAHFGGGGNSDPLYAWNGGTLDLAPLSAFTTAHIPQSTRRPRLYIPESALTAKEKSHLVTGNRIMLHGYDVNWKPCYRYGIITGTPSTFTHSSVDYLHIEFLDTGANLRRHLFNSLHDMDLHKPHSIVFPTNDTHDVMRFACSLIGHTGRYTVESAAYDTDIDSVVIAGKFTSTAQLGFYRGQHILFASGAVMHDTDGDPITPAGHFLNALHYSNVRYTAKETITRSIVQHNTCVKDIELLSDGSARVYFDEAVPANFTSATTPTDTTHVVLCNSFIFPINGPDPELKIGNTQLRVERRPASMNFDTTIQAEDYLHVRQTLTAADTTYFTYKPNTGTDFVLFMFPKPTPSHPTITIFPELAKYRVLVDNTPQTQFDVPLDARSFPEHIRILEKFFREGGKTLGDLSMHYGSIRDTVATAAADADTYTDDTIDRLLVIPVILERGSNHTIELQMHLSGYTPDTFDISVLERNYITVDLAPGSSSF